MSEIETTTAARRAGTRRWFLGGVAGAAGAALAAWTGIHATAAREREPGDDRGGHGRHHHHRHHHEDHHHHRGNHR